MERNELRGKQTPGIWTTADWNMDFGSDETTVETTNPEGNHSMWPGGVAKRRVAETAGSDNPLPDAALIAEAGTVANETGMWPLDMKEKLEQLWESNHRNEQRIKELEALLREWLTKEDASTPDNYEHNETSYKAKVRAILNKKS